MNRLPPHDKEAEKSVIGSCFLNGNPALDEARAILEVNDFWFEKHRMIFETLIELQKKKVPFTDIVPVMDALGNKVTPAELTEMINYTNNPDNIKHYAAIVKDKSLARQKINYCADIIKKLYDDEDPRKIISKSIFDDTNLLNNDRRTEVIHIKDCINDILDEFESRRFNHGLIGVSSGFDELDRYTGGWRNGSMYIIGARPKMGKTSIALKFAKNAAAKGVSTLIKSLEMTKSQLIEKLISEETGIILDKFKNTSDLNDKEWNLIVNASAKLSEMPLYIDDKPSKASQFEVTLRRYKSTHKIGLAVADYIQRFKPETVKGSKTEQVSEISNLLCDMAKDISVPLIALAQLTRDVERRDDKTPRASDLKQSGDLEADAAAVFLLYRDDYYYPENYPPKNDPSIVNFIIDLNRFGPTGVIDFSFHKSCSRFYLLDKHHEQKIA